MSAIRGMIGMHRMPGKTLMPEMPGKHEMTGVAGFPAWND